MDFKFYLGYKVFEDGSVFNKKGIKLIPQKTKSSYYFNISNNGISKRIQCGRFILFAFEKYPPLLESKVRKINGVKEDFSLSNLKWY